MKASITVQRSDWLCCPSDNNFINPLHLQDGSLPDHSPLLWHTLVEPPTRRKPLLQL